MIAPYPTDETIKNEIENLYLGYTIFLYGRKMEQSGLWDYSPKSKIKIRVIESKGPRI